MLCGQAITFLVDTGSAIDALHIDTYNALEFPPKLETSFYPQVFTVDNSTTETFGQFDAYIMVTDGEVTAALELPLHVMNCGNSQGIHDQIQHAVGYQTLIGHTHDR